MSDTERQRLSEDTAILHAMATAGIRIDDRRFERAVINVLAEYDRRGAELARVRPVVDAAEALVEHWGQANRVLPEDYIARNGQLLDVLAEKVKEAQR